MSMQNNMNMNNMNMNMSNTNNIEQLFLSKNNNLSSEKANKTSKKTNLNVLISSLI